MTPLVVADPPSEFTPSTNVFARLREHPTGFWFVFSGELAERASYYGMRTLLALYMIEVLGFSQAGGATVMKAFMASCFVTPFIGGWVADRYLGCYRTIVYYSVPYLLGHIILGGFQTPTGLFVALALLAFGSGAIKPTASVLLGQIYDAEKKSPLLNEAFSLYYAAINVGGAATALSLPLIVRAQGGRYGLALTIPAVLMGVSLGVFALGKRWYPPEHVSARRPVTTGAQREAARQTLARIAGVFGCIAIFWLIYEQNADTWIYFAHSHTDLRLFNGIEMTANQTQALNPVFIVLLTPLFNWIWNHARRRRGGREVPDTRKMLFGYVIVVASSVIMAYAAWLARDGATVTLWWVILATFLMTLAELCISPVGLEFSYRHAAPGTKSVVTAAFHMTIFVGSSVGLIFAPAYEKALKPDAYFGLLAVIMIVATLVFVGVSRKFERAVQAT